MATVPDDEDHAIFERIDGRIALGRESRWSTCTSLGSTAAMLGDWDLQSTLLAADPAGGRACAWPSRRFAPASPSWRKAPDRSARFPAQAVHRLARVPPRLGEPLSSPAGRRVRDRASDGDRRSSAVADVVGAGADARRRLLLQPRMAGRGARAAAALDAPRPDFVLRLATLRLRPLAARTLSRLALWPAAGHHAADARLVGNASR